MLQLVRVALRLSIGLSVIVSIGCKNDGDGFGAVLEENSGGGKGVASIAISSYSPGSAALAIKSSASQQFVVAATGEGVLTYKWTLDGVTVGDSLSSFTLNASLYSVGLKTLKVTIFDKLGSVSQEWAVKINGTPVVTSSTPSGTTANLRRTSTLSFSVVATDPNNDTLTYVWKLDGQENVFSSVTNSNSWTTTTTDVGQHVVSVDIYDGAASDTGTYKITRSWTTYVNHFSGACNEMENSNQTNKSCVYVGIPGIGDGLDPDVNPSNFLLRPAALAFTTEGNLFIADDTNHVVWFWNRYSIPSTTALGVTVPVNQMKVVAGVGYPSSGNSASTKAIRNFLSSPHGLAWSGTYLYIADSSNNRVLRVDSNGDITSVFTTGCNSPRGLALYGTDIFVACYSSNIIRQINISTLVAVTFAGTGAAANPVSLAESSFTDATNGMLNGPYGVVADSSGNLYVSEYTGSRVHFYNRSGSTVTFYGTHSISANAQRIISGVAGAPPACVLATGEPVDITAAANGALCNPRLLSLSPTGELLVSHDGDQIAAINFSASGTSLMGVAIPGYTLKGIVGSGTAGYIGDGQAVGTTRLNNPFHVARDPITGDYFFADYSNLRLRKVKASNNLTELVAGTGSTRVATNAGQGQLEVGQEKMNQIRGLAFDSVSGDVFVSDYGNNRIRVFNRYGIVSQAVGTGTSGSGSEEDDYPSNVTMTNPRALVLTHSSATYGGHLVWADGGNHRIRLYNRKATDETVFGVTVGAGKVVTIGGNGTSGTATSGSALQAAFNTPSGLATDGTNLYISDLNNHCIKKIDSSGTLSKIAGTCGTAGNVNGPVDTGRLNGPENIDYYVNGTHQGLLIADRGNSRVRFLRFAGSSLLFGSAISVGDANTIACGGTFHTEGITSPTLAICNQVYDVAMVGTKVCFSNFGYHNVRCLSATGEITTLAGTVQGIDDTTNLYFPGASLASGDYSSSTPNYSNYNGVTAFGLPSPIAEPVIGSSVGAMHFPFSIKALDSKTVIVADYYLSLIRKIKFP